MCLKAAIEGARKGKDWAHQLDSLPYVHEIPNGRDLRGIVYLAPLRIDQRVRITSATSRVLRISIAEGDEKFSAST